MNISELLPTIPADHPDAALVAASHKARGAYAKFNGALCVGDVDDDYRAEDAERDFDQAAKALFALKPKTAQGVRAIAEVALEFQYLDAMGLRHLMRVIADCSALA